MRLSLNTARLRDIQAGMSSKQLVVWSSGESSELKRDLTMVTTGAGDTSSPRQEQLRKKKDENRTWAEKSTTPIPNNKQNKSMKKTRKNSEIGKKNNYPVLMGYYICFTLLSLNSCQITSKQIRTPHARYNVLQETWVPVLGILCTF